MDLLDAYALIALMALSSASVVWYFKMRKKMLKFLRDFTVELEEVIKPRDKEYLLLGYLVGYKATYTLTDGSNVYVLLTTAPMHSLLYYPIAKALKRENNVVMALKPSNRAVVRDIHAVKDDEKRYKYLLEKDLGDEINKLNKSRIYTNWGIYEIYYEDPRDVNYIQYILNNDKNLPIYKISAYKKLNMVEIATRAEVGKVEYLYESLRDFAKKITKSTTTRDTA